MLVRALLLIPLTLALSFGPGFFLLRRSGWRPLELVSGAIGLSLTLLFAASFGVFALGLPHTAYVAIALGGAAMTLASARDAVRLFSRPGMGRTLAAFGALAAWVLLAQSLIRHYSGGDWCCDWFEHYQRTLHFVNDGPPRFLFIGRYLLTARPPLMNVVTGLFLSQVGQEFALYQTVCSVLNLLIFFPCCLFAALVAPERRASPGLIAAMLAFNPMFVMNATFTWTKVTSAMFVLLGVCLFVRGVRVRDRRRMTHAFVFLSAGVLAHYSAAPYLLVVGGAFLALAIHWELRPLAAAAVLAPGALLGGVWFCWAIGEYGFAGVLLTNSSVGGTAEFTVWQNVVRVASNAFHTFRPYLWPGHPQDTALRLVADRTFTFYQENLLGGIGSVSGPLAIALLARAWWDAEGPRSVERLFWTTFVPVTLVVGIAVDGETSPSGVANICLQPLVYMAVVWLAVHFGGLGRRVRVLLASGLMVDLVLGVLLELHMEHDMRAWARTPNWDWKFDNNVVFLGDVLLKSTNARASLMALLAAGGLLIIWRQAWVGPAYRAGQTTSSP